VFVSLPMSANKNIAFQNQTEQQNIKYIEKNNMTPNVYNNQMSNQSYQFFSPYDMHKHKQLSEKTT